MANEFSKEERVAFEEILEGFQDATIMAKNAVIYNTDQTQMARAGDVVWRPQPYIARSYDGMDQTANFRDKTQLSVPATISFPKSVPWVMDAMELRDLLQSKRLGDAAKQRLASDINVAVLNVAALQGTLVVPRVGVGATGFADVALCDAIMNEQGVPDYDRFLALSTRDYNGMAANLAARDYMPGKVNTAYERAYVGRISGFETFKLDYARRIAVAGGGAALTMTTLAAGGNVYVPTATRTAATGERANVDNRYQTVTWNSTAGVVAGDCFTIATVNAVHHITKEDTGQLKTFRVIEVLTGTTLVMSPPMISAQGGTDAELEYQNCVVNTPAANSAIVFLNTAAAPANPFWQKDAIEILPGRYEIDEGSGVKVMRGSTDEGIEIVMQKQYDIKTMKTLFRWDCLFGVVNKQPEMSGIMLFNQV